MSLTGDGHFFPSAVILLTNVGWNYILANVGYRAEWSKNACTYVKCAQHKCEWKHKVYSK